MPGKEDTPELVELHLDGMRSRFSVKPYLFWALLILGTFVQWFLLWKFWIGKPLPEILGEVNGLAPSRT